MSADAREPPPGAAGGVPLDAPSISLALLRAGVPPGDLDSVAPLLAGMTARALADGEVLVRQGEPPGEAYILHEGLLDVLRAGLSGVEVVAVLGPGALVGEMSLATGEPRAATVRARGPARLYALPPAVFAGLLAQSRGFAAHVARLVETRRRELGRV